MQENKKAAEKWRNKAAKEVAQTPKPLSADVGNLSAKKAKHEPKTPQGANQKEMEEGGIKVAKDPAY